jgi:hypothetical protein
MNTSKITLIALIALTMLVLPVSAVWMNGNWYTDDQYAKLTDGATVICTGKNSDQCSKYRDTNPALGNDVATAAGTCNLAGTLACGYTTLTPTVYISNALDTNKTQTPLSVDHNGRYEYRGLAKGNYTLYVPDGNGGQPEYSSVQCLGSGDVWPFRQILGHAVTADSAPDACYRQIVSAQYGAFEEQCGEPYTVHHGDYTREWMPKVCHGSGWFYHCHDGYWDYDHVGMGNGDYVKDCGRHSCSYEYVAPTQDQDCETVGGYTDVTSNVASVIATGHTSFVLSNGWLGNYQGGIFDNEADRNLLSSIDDPAKDIVKHVTIEYKDCTGNPRKVSAEEYQQITLL